MRKVAVLLVVAIAQLVLSQHLNVNTWGCKNGDTTQQLLMDNDGHILPVGIPNRCLHVNDDSGWTVNKCSGDQRQVFLYHAPTQTIRHTQNKDENLNKHTCLTLTTHSSQKEEFGAQTLFLKCNGGDAQKWNVSAADGHISSIGLPGLCLDYASTWQCDEQDSLIAGHAMCNSQLSSTTRAQDLASRMSPEEKMNQLMNNAPPLARLGLQNYNYWSEALHGVVSWDDTVTMFPQIIGLGAGFNASMYLAMGQAISTEARALWNKNIGGLTYWAPNINIFRDPRWGRGQETPGEDPLLSSVYVSNFVSGMQNGDPKFTKVVSTCKHYAAYSLESWKGIERYGFNAIVDHRDLEETYLPAFKSCITEGKARSIMCSYNAVNGKPACASPYLLQQKLRDEWGFKGFVVSDCDAVSNVFDPHHFSNTTYGAAAASLKAGTDLDCGDFYKHLPEAYNKGLINDDDLNRAIVRIFAERIELGMFNRASNPWEQIPLSEINTNAHKELSLVAARESMVLLKNQNQTLPLASYNIVKIGVIGPNADDANVMRGNYDGNPPYLISALQGIQDLHGHENVLFAKSCEVEGNDTSGFGLAIDVATKADVVVLIVGINQNVEREGVDRYDITLPGVQNYLIQAVLKAAAGKKVIVVLINGGPLDISDLRDDRRVGAILEAWYGGQSGGTAIAEVLLGKTNPAGLLPVTVYPQKYVSQIPLTDMAMRPFPGRTHKYLQIEPVYKFGHGLSYTSFEISVASKVNVLYRPVKSSIKLLVKNTGNRDGDFVGLAFARHKDDDFASKKGTLAAFNRIHVRIGETVEMELPFTDHSFERFVSGKMVTIGYDFTITVRGTQNSNTIQFVASVR
jgi:beta-glucosidase-like glycosyl hydrolase